MDDPKRRKVQRMEHGPASDDEAVPVTGELAWGDDWIPPIGRPRVPIPRLPPLTPPEGTLEPNTEAVVVGRSAQRRLSVAVNLRLLLAALAVAGIVWAQGTVAWIRWPLSLVLVAFTVGAVLSAWHLRRWHWGRRRGAVTVSPAGASSRRTGQRIDFDQIRQLEIVPERDTSRNPPDDPPSRDTVPGFAVVRETGSDLYEAVKVDLRDDDDSVRHRVLAVLLAWAVSRPEIVQDQYTAWVLGVPAAPDRNYPITPWTGVGHRIPYEWRAPAFSVLDGELEDEEAQRFALARTAYDTISAYVETTWVRSVRATPAHPSTRIRPEPVTGEWRSESRDVPDYEVSVHHVGASTPLWLGHDLLVSVVIGSPEFSVHARLHPDGPASALRDLILDDLAVVLDFPRDKLPRGRYWGNPRLILPARPDLDRRGTTEPSRSRTTGC